MKQKERKNWSRVASAGHIRSSRAMGMTVLKMRAGQVKFHFMIKTREGRKKIAAFKVS